MRRRRARIDWRESAARLREAALELPVATGVYEFRAESGAPLYIGKSKDIRARVLTHLRDARNARLIRQTRTLAHRRTAGEIGALLLEAQLIKERRPLWNKRLKRNLDLCSIRLREGRPQIVCAHEMDFGAAADLCGLFRHRAQAEERLRALADEWRLCLALLGLEPRQRSRGCFRAAIGRCAGACRGDEPESAHAGRVRDALGTLALASWPYPGAVGLVECGPDMRQVHVIRNWCYLGSVEHEAEAAGLSRVAAGFDVDGYRILVRPLLERRAELLQL